MIVVHRDWLVKCCDNHFIDEAQTCRAVTTRKARSTLSVTLKRFYCVTCVFFFSASIAWPGFIPDSNYRLFVIY